MKKFIVCALIGGGIAALYKYVDKNGLPIISNVTMNLPFELPFDAYDLLDKGIEMVE